MMITVETLAMLFNLKLVKESIFQLCCLYCAKMYSVWMKKALCASPQQCCTRRHIGATDECQE